MSVSIFRIKIGRGISPLASVIQSATGALTVILCSFIVLISYSVNKESSNFLTHSDMLSSGFLLGF